MGMDGFTILLVAVRYVLFPLYLMRAVDVWSKRASAGVMFHMMEEMQLRGVFSPEKKSFKQLSLSASRSFRGR